MSDSVRPYRQPPTRLLCPQDSLGKNTGVGSLSLLQGIFTTQGLNPGLPHCRRILYQLSHKESPRIMEWVAYLFSSEYSQPRNQTGISCIAGEFFFFLPTEVSGKSFTAKVIIKKNEKTTCRMGENICKQCDR